MKDRWLFATCAIGLAIAFLATMQAAYARGAAGFAVAGSPGEADSRVKARPPAEVSRRDRDQWRDSRAPGKLPANRPPLVCKRTASNTALALRRAANNTAQTPRQTGSRLQGVCSRAASRQLSGCNQAPGSTMADILTLIGTQVQDGPRPQV